MSLIYQHTIATTLAVVSYHSLSMWEIANGQSWSVNHLSQLGLEFGVIKIKSGAKNWQKAIWGWTIFSSPSSGHE